MKSTSLTLKDIQDNIPSLKIISFTFKLFHVCKIPFIFKWICGDFYIFNFLSQTGFSNFLVRLDLYFDDYLNEFLNKSHPRS